MWKFKRIREKNNDFKFIFKMKNIKEKKNLLKETKSLIEESQKIKEKYFTEVLDKKFIVYPGVFSPKFFNSTEFFAKEIPINQGEKFLEMGCGTGIISIFALYRGVNEVTCTDINEMAVKNTKENLKIHEFLRNSKVYHGDLFEKIKEKYDKIFWSMPFGFINNNKINDLERSVFDPNYNSIIKFIKESKDYLKKDGKLLIGFSKTLGHYDLLENVLKENKFSYTEVKENYIKEKREIKFQIIEATSL